MCLARAFLADKSDRELVLEDVALIEIDEGMLRLSTIFGEQKEIGGILKEVDFQNSRVVIEKAG